MIRTVMRRYSIGLLGDQERSSSWLALRSPWIVLASSYYGQCVLCSVYFLYLPAPTVPGFLTICAVLKPAGKYYSSTTADIRCQRERRGKPAPGYDLSLAAAEPSHKAIITVLLAMVMRGDIWGLSKILRFIGGLKNHHKRATDLS